MRVLVVHTPDWATGHQFMLDREEERRTQRLIIKVERLYQSQVMNCSLDTVGQHMRLHPIRFKRCLSKARRYAKRHSYEEVLVVWTARAFGPAMASKVRSRQPARAIRV